MRFQGKIIQWQDDKGYGFVTPNGGGQQAFVHIKSFTGAKRRPANGDLITYEAVTDGKGRLSAKKIQFTRKPKLQYNTDTTWYGTAFAVLFYSLLYLLVWLNKLDREVLWLYSAASALLFGLCAVDKRAAQRSTQRTPESTLQFIALMGGWPGGLLAQKILKHKNKKASFQRVFWIAVIINLVVFGLGFRYGV